MKSFLLFPELPEPDIPEPDIPAFRIFADFFRNSKPFL